MLIFTFISTFSIWRCLIAIHKKKRVINKLALFFFLLQIIFFNLKFIYGLTMICDWQSLTVCTCIFNWLMFLYSSEISFWGQSTLVDQSMRKLTLWSNQSDKNYISKLNFCTLIIQYNNDNNNKKNDWLTVIEVGMHTRQTKFYRNTTKNDISQINSKTIQFLNLTKLINLQSSLRHANQL